jgi:hypothetical protein
MPNTAAMKLATEQMKRMMDVTCIAGPSDKYAALASINANASKRRKRPMNVTTIVARTLRPFARMARAKKTVAATTLQATLNQNAGTALSGVDPGKVSVRTGGMTHMATMRAITMTRIAQARNEMRQNLRLIISVFSQRLPQRTFHGRSSRFITKGSARRISALRLDTKAKLVPG